MNYSHHWATAMTVVKQKSSKNAGGGSLFYNFKLRMQELKIKIKKNLLHVVVLMKF